MGHPAEHDPAAAPSHPPEERPFLFLSTLAAVDAFVLRAVCVAHPRVHLVHLTDEPDPRRPGRLRRVLAHPGRSLVGGLRDHVQAPGRRRMERRIERTLFGPHGCPEPTNLGAYAVTARPAWQVRDPALRAEIAAIGPARMLVCGAPWLPSGLCTVATHGTFNVHWGVVPDYRGGNSIFWALAEGRTDRIGVTIHEITPRIDAGDVVAQGRVAVRAGDDEETLWVACAHEAAALAEGLVALPVDEPLVTRPQGPGGRCYRYAERTVLRELRLAGARLLGRRPVPHAGSREPARTRRPSQCSAQARGTLGSR